MPDVSFFDRVNGKRAAARAAEQEAAQEGAATVERGKKTVTLWRPVGPAELSLIQASGMRGFPPRLPDQPIFYPVLSEGYATKIARDWNAPRGGGFVLRFEVDRAYLDGHRVEQAGGRDHLEYWIPAEELPLFNAAIVGPVEVTASFPPPEAAPAPSR